jgi:rsbT co-antagonist protein RsbR
MNNAKKTKKQLADELSRAHARIAELEVAITERDRTTGDVLSTQGLLQTLLDSVPYHIYFKDAQSRFIRINKAMATAFGLGDPAEAIGKTDFDFFTEEHARPAFEDERRVMQSGQPVFREEKETWPDGRVTWVSTVKMPSRDAEENIVGTFGVSRDITAEKQVQEESAYLQNEVIEAHRRALRELSTPIIPVIERVIVMPLIGSIDTLRARDITRVLLAGIREHRARVVILDITGVPIVDSGVAAYLNKTIQAARLKGARTIVTGVSNAVAETIVDQGIDWSGIETLGDLQTGLIAALNSLGLELVRSGDNRR